MNEYEFTERSVDLSSVRERDAVAAFLARFGLGYEDGVEYTVVFERDGQMAGTGSFAGKVIQCVAVDPDYQEGGLGARVITHLLSEMAAHGVFHVFLYTRPQSTPLFEAMGFRVIARCDGAVLLETGPGSVDEFVAQSRLEANRQWMVEGLSVDAAGVSAIVANCNPMTLGHLHLIETAARVSKAVVVFIVSEEASSFPAAARLRIAQSASTHLRNVAIVPGGDYLVSKATFPSYFTRAGDLLRTQAALDLDLFGRHFVPAFGISRRFVGEEPYCEVTRAYNETMKTLLPHYGVEVVEIRRLQSPDNRPVSASIVRQLLRDGSVEGVRGLVPDATYRHLLSAEGQEVIEKLKSHSGRH